MKVQRPDLADNSHSLFIIYLSRLNCPVNVYIYLIHLHHFSSISLNIFITPLDPYSYLPLCLEYFASPWHCGKLARLFKPDDMLHCSKHIFWFLSGQKWCPLSCSSLSHEWILLKAQAHVPSTMLCIRDWTVSKKQSLPLMCLYPVWKRQKK